MDNKTRQKTRQKHYCEICDYRCNKHSDMQKHFKTIKHLDNMDNKNSPELAIDKIPSFTEQFICECGKEYMYKSGLCKHKQKCNYVNEPIKEEEKKDLNLEMVMELIKNVNNNNNTDTIMELIKQNQEFKELIVDQNKTIMDLSSRTNSITSNSNNTINNNQKFNLNFFLNNTCKDAMNMSEFIENMNVNFNDIEYIGRNGYVNGMTNMILSRIKELDVTKRPLHCTDLKRETMYIKDNDEWNKDTPDNTQLRNMVKIVAKHNQYQFPIWREKHPASDDMNSATFEFSLKMIQNILGDVGEEHIKLDNKVMRNLSKHILVDKN